MDKSALVNLDIAEGAEVTSALEDGGVPLTASVWMTTPEYGDGRLFIASDAFPNEVPQEGYGKVVDILRARFKRHVLPIVILKTSDPFVVDLRKRLAAFGSPEGHRLSGQMVGNRFVDEGYVYRVAS